MPDKKELIQEWIDAKRDEAEAIERRRWAEDTLIKSLGLSSDFEGTENYLIGDYKVKVVGRMNRKVDSERLQAIAAEHGLSQHLGALFRWKPEIVATAWKSADPSITNPLLGAVTTTPGRPSFSIDTKES